MENKIRAFKNSLKAEPYQKTNSHFQEVMFGSPPISEYIRVMEEMSYAKFKRFKEKFFKNLSFQWLICGHLTEERALKLCDIALESLDHRPIDRDELLLYQQLIKLPDRSVHDFDKG